jgi:formylmethanofuran dehydrogenase subunit E
MSNDHDHCHLYNITKDYTARDLAAFHGHLGPYIVLGYRMGRYARDNFCSDPFAMKAAVHCSGTPPESCVVDGVQIGSGCTLGKRNIEIVVAPSIRCEFSGNGNRLVLVPRPYTPPPKGEHYEAAIEHFAEEMLAMPDAELFTVARP